ncbi:MAG: galactokinase family protein, partial [Chloroflexota bacterium]
MIGSEAFKTFAKRVQLNNELFFDPNEPMWFGRAPGRLDVMGGIADYSGSLVLEMPIAEATFTAVQVNNSPDINIISFRNGRSQPPAQFAMPLATLHTHPTAKQAATFFKQTSDSSWAAYIAGALWLLKREKGISFPKGLNILVDSSVPEGKGVSSSAAVEVATMQALSQSLNLALMPTELAILCQQVENEIADAPCGIMDQMTVVNGRKNKLLALLCQPATILGQVTIPSDLAFW